MSKKTFGNLKADRTKTNCVLELLQFSIPILLFPLFRSHFSLPFTSKLPCIWTLLLNALASHQKEYLTAPTHQWQKWNYCSFLPITVQGLTTITESGLQFTSFLFPFRITPILLYYFQTCVQSIRFLHLLVGYQYNKQVYYGASPFSIISDFLLFSP